MVGPTSTGRVNCSLGGDLTRQELRIAQLVSEGYSNAQVARVLTSVPPRCIATWIMCTRSYLFTIDQD